MISAFTLCLSFDGMRPERRPLCNYFIRRFFRIAPLFYLLICLNLMLQNVLGEFSPLRHLPRLDILLGFLFLNGTRPRAINTVVMGGWSIAVETTFYLILPLLWRYVTTVRRALVLFLISAPMLLKLSAWLTDRTGDADRAHYFSFYWFPVEFPVFILGILCYFIWRDYLKGQQLPSSRQKELSALLLVSSFVIYYASLPFYDWRLYPSSYLFLPLILGLSLHPWKFIINPVTRFLGKISYSLYLLHPFALILTGLSLRKLDTLPGHPASRFILARPLGLPVGLMLVMAMSIPVSMLSWKFIEQPGIRLGRRLIARLEGKTTAVESPLIPSLEQLDVVGNTRDAQF